MSPGGGEGSKETAPVHLQVASFACFAMGNIGLNYFNAWALHDSEVGVPGLGSGGFTFPYFYTMWHMLATSCAALAMQLTCVKPADGKLPSFAQIWQYKYQLVPIAILTYFNAGFNNASLGSIALFVNQVIKATAPLPTSIFEFLIMGRLQPLRVYGVIFALVGGCVLANSSSFAAGGTTELGGIIQCLISLVAATLRPVLQKLLISGGKGLRPCAGGCDSCGAGEALSLLGTDSDAPRLSPPQALFWDTGLAFFIFLFCWLAFERESSIAYLAGNTTNPKSGLLGVGIISFGSFLAFFFNIANYYFIFYTSALSSSVGSNGVKIFIIVMSAFQLSLVPLSWVGVAIVVISIGMYAYLQHGIQRQAAAGAASTEGTGSTPLVDSLDPKDANAGKAERYTKLDERTPLASSKKQVEQV